MSNEFFDLLTTNYVGRASSVVRFSDSESYNGNDLLSLIAGSSKQLLEAGVNPGDRIAIEAQPTPSYVGSVLGAIALGAIVVPVNPNATLSEMQYCLRDATVRFAIGSGRIFSEATSNLSYDLKSYQGVGSDLHVPNGCTTISVSAEQIRPDEVPIPKLSIDAPCLIGYTSGTTGKPKGALLSLRNLYTSAKGLIEAWGWTKEDHLLHFLPLYHMHGLGVGLFASLAAGSKISFLDRFSEDGLFSAIDSGDITMIFGVPTIYERIARDSRLNRLAKLRIFVSGSAPLPTDLFERLRENLGKGPVERYGMTETVMNTSNPAVGTQKPGKVGLPLSGVLVKIADDGEVLIKGDNVMLGYLGRPEATADSFTPEGYFKTGDLGEVDVDGYLEIKGRKKDLIISGGFNVYPKEVEAELRSFSAIRDAAVVGRPSQLWGEEVVAFVECEGTVNTAEVLDFLRKQLSAYKVPKQIFIVDELPRNNMGKVVYAMLRERL
ncbi:MAG: AMP-binding protein [Actinomycetota bacterium]|nr:AMP-binding protein [Actinomycetota bacterium]